MSSVARRSSKSVLSSMPGMRNGPFFVIVDIAQYRCVIIDMPLSMASDVWSRVASLWPPEGMMPWRLRSRMNSWTPGTSGARVMRLMIGARSRKPRFSSRDGFRTKPGSWHPCFVGAM